MSGSKINHELLLEVATNEPLAEAGRQFGDIGSKRLKDILSFIKRCSSLATVGEKTKLEIFALITSSTKIDVARQKLAKALAFESDIRGEIKSLEIEIRADGSAFIWTKIPLDVKNALKNGVVYRLMQGSEEFVIKGKPLAVRKIIESTSQFFVHYFGTLKEALEAYRDTMARTCTCYMLREVWHDENRFWLKAGPEWLMRRALCNFLRGALRCDNMELRPEQNVDESHPVDIKITWQSTNRAALIEVKWIGHSRSKDSNRITAKYTESRARSGAKQLAEYLEEHKQESARADTRGYLVVLDGRRKNLKITTTTLLKRDGLHFSQKEIRYNPDYSVRRSDFEKPIRMFVEPVCL